MKKVALHWSGGKDSALALSLLSSRGDVEVDRLVTTVAPEGEVSTVHEVPVELLHAQAHSLGIPLHTIPMHGDGLQGYAEAMGRLGVELRREGVEAVAFGDLKHSGGLRYRQATFGDAGIEVLEPLWALEPRECIDHYLASGFSAVIVVVDAAVLEATHAGLALDRDFVDGLPDGADPCGEFGEYHSFVYDGPLFATPVVFTLSEPRLATRTVGTTEGPRDYAYWMCTPSPAAVSPVR